MSKVATHTRIHTQHMYVSIMKALLSDSHTHRLGSPEQFALLSDSLLHSGRTRYIPLQTAPYTHTNTSSPCDESDVHRPTPTRSRTLSPSASCKHSIYSLLHFQYTRSTQHFHLNRKDMMPHHFLQLIGESQRGIKRVAGRKIENSKKKESISYNILK